MKTFDVRKIIKHPIYFGRFYGKSTGKKTVSFYEQDSNQHVACITLDVAVKTKMVKSGKKKKKQTTFKLIGLTTDLYLVRNELLDCNTSAASYVRTGIDLRTIVDRDEKCLVEELLTSRSDELKEYLSGVFNGNMKMFYSKKQVFHAKYHYFKEADMLFMRTNEPLWDFAAQRDMNSLKDTACIRYDVYSNLNYDGGSKTAADEGLTDWDEIIGTGEYIGYVYISPSKQHMGICVAGQEQSFFRIRRCVKPYIRLPLPHSDDRYMTGHYEDKRYLRTAVVTLHRHLYSKETKVHEAEKAEFNTNVPSVRFSITNSFSSTPYVVEPDQSEVKLVSQVPTDAESTKDAVVGHGSVYISEQRKAMVRAALMRHFEAHVGLSNMYTKFNQVPGAQPRYTFCPNWPWFVSPGNTGYKEFPDLSETSQS